MPDTAPRAKLDEVLGLGAIPSHPDAVLLTAIERYLHLRDVTERGAERRGRHPVADGGWREMEALEAEIGRIPAGTALGARAKLELALDLMPGGGAAHAIPVSALRDCLAALDAESGRV